MLRFIVDLQIFIIIIFLVCTPTYMGMCWINPYDCLCVSVYPGMLVSNRVSNSFSCKYLKHFSSVATQGPYFIYLCLSSSSRINDTHKHMLKETK